MKIVEVGKIVEIECIDMSGVKWVTPNTANNKNSMYVCRGIKGYKIYI